MVTVREIVHETGEIYLPSKMALRKEKIGPIDKKRGFLHARL
jgi:hypothetical protein